MARTKKRTPGPGKFKNFNKKFKSTRPEKEFIENENIVNLLDFEKTSSFLEKKVGIERFLSNNEFKFSANLKQIYSDFIVNEIDEDENIVELKNLQVPLEFVRFFNKTNK